MRFPSLFGNKQQAHTYWEDKRVPLHAPSINTLLLRSSIHPTSYCVPVYNQVLLRLFSQATIASLHRGCVSKYLFFVHPKTSNFPHIIKTRDSLVIEK